MVHFLRQIQAYCQLEVIECSWSAMLEYMDKREGDLDALIKAHRTYVDRVVRKILLLGPKAEKEEVLLGQVREALDHILQFRDATVRSEVWDIGLTDRTSCTLGRSPKPLGWIANGMSRGSVAPSRHKTGQNG
jgi:gamma-tubulin complex component 3